MSHHLRRALLAGAAVQNGLNKTEEQEHDDDWHFDPRIFWAVNACFLVALLATCCYCSYGDRSCFTRAHERRLQTDLEYQRNLAAREERKRQAKIMSPAKRKRLLLASFVKHQVIMVSVAVPSKMDLLAQVMVLSYLFSVDGERTRFDRGSRRKHERARYPRCPR